MTKNINLASTDTINKAQLDLIVKNVGSRAKKRFANALKKFNLQVEQEIKDARKKNNQ